MILHGLPFPPSLNNLYVNNPRTRGRFKSKEGKEFDHKIMLYSLEHSHTVRQFVPAPAYRLRLSFYITLGKLLTKEQKIKRLDISNRIKPIEDALCAMLSIDDKDFVEVTALKLLSPRDHSWVDASIISLDISPEELFKT